MSGARRRTYRGRASRAFVLIGVAASAAASCSPAPDREADAARGPAAWSVPETPRLLVGEREGAPEYLFQRIRAVRLLADGRLAVADQGARTVRIYDEEGDALRSLGGEGEGPGEFRYIVDLRILGDDTLAVYDMDNLRLTLFAADGALLGTVPVRGQAPDQVMGRTDAGDWIMAWIDQEAFDRNPTDPDPDPMRVGRFGPDGAFREVMAQVDGMVRQDHAPVPFSPFFHGWVVGDSVVFTDGSEPEVSVLAPDGHRARTLELALPALDPDSARQALEAALEAMGEVRRADDVSESAWDRPVPYLAEMLVDDTGKLWLKHYEPRVDSWLLGRGFGRGGGGTWSVVKLDGTEVARVELPDDFLVMDVRQDQVAGVRVDELGVERVAVYPLVH